ncbi:hypothetical protein GCM10008915_45320 [Bifidobacterium pullorum subsp. gallinarum]
MGMKTLTLKIHENATEIGINGEILTYRPEGKRLQYHLMSKIDNCELLEFINLDFQNVEVSDVSFIDEIVFQLSSIIKQEKPNVIVYISNLDEYVYDSIRAAQLLKEDKLSKSSKEKKRLPLLYYTKDEFQIIGELEAILEETFDLIKSHHDGITARDIAKAKGIAINSSSNRLKKLYDYGLIQRKTITDNSGVYFKYLLPSV